MRDNNCYQHLNLSSLIQTVTNIRASRDIPFSFIKNDWDIFPYNILSNFTTTKNNDIFRSMVRDALKSWNKFCGIHFYEKKQVGVFDNGIIIGLHKAADSIEQLEHAVTLGNTINEESGQAIIRSIILIPETKYHQLFFKNFNELKEISNLKEKINKLKTTLLETEQKHQMIKLATNIPEATKQMMQNQRNEALQLITEWQAHYDQLQIIKNDDTVIQETILHEIGHALGFEHPHEYPNIWAALNKTECATRCTIMDYNYKLSPLAQQCNTSQYTDKLGIWDKDLCRFFYPATQDTAVRIPEKAQLNFANNLQASYFQLINTIPSQWTAGFVEGFCKNIKFDRRPFFSENTANLLGQAASFLLLYRNGLSLFFVLPSLLLRISTHPKHLVYQVAKFIPLLTFFAAFYYQVGMAAYQNPMSIPTELVKVALMLYINYAVSEMGKVTGKAASSLVNLCLFSRNSSNRHNDDNNETDDNVDILLQPAT